MTASLTLITANGCFSEKKAFGCPTFKKAGVSFRSKFRYKKKKSVI